MKPIPIFKDHSSTGLFTPWKISECVEGGPPSIVKVAKDNGLKEVYVVSDHFYTFLELHKNLKAEGISLRFGLELHMCNDAAVHDDNSLTSNHKVVVFSKNSQGYQDLIKIYTACHTNPANKYYRYRFDYQQLAPLWTDNLVLTLPFFDSFLHVNKLKYNANIVPDLSFAGPLVLFREVDNGIPFAPLIDEAVTQFAREQYEIVPVKTCYYETAADLPAWMVYRGIGERGATLFEPKMDYCCSDQFSFEAWKALQ